ncbi:hypothetical protein PTKIN_Ptkin06aG0125000 [Pterospermum kingtungense]
MEKISRQCGYFSCFYVGAEGRSGGLAMMWRGDCTLQLRSFSKNHIDMEVNLEDGSTEWRLTGVYGELNTRNRATFWSLLRRLSVNNDKAWLCLGDFNEILVDYEKSGLRERSNG